MKKQRNIALIACIMLVTLRLMIGWQLLYEGLWKIRTLNSPKPWTAAGYLKNSMGPFRPMFREMAGNPDDLDWLDVKKTSARWDDWHKRFVSHYKLNKRQQGRLKQWINGQDSYKAEIGQVPEDYNNVVFEYKLDKEVKDDFQLKGADVKGKKLSFEPGLLKVLVDGRGFKDFEASEDGTTITLKPKADKPIKSGASIQVLAGRRLMELRLDDVVGFEAGDKNYIVVDGRRHMTTPEREKLIAQLEADGLGGLVDAVQKVYKQAKDGISFKERLSATVRGNPDWTSNEKLQRVGEIEKYESMLAEYEKKLTGAEQDFNWDHLQHNWGKIQALRSELTGPVKALEDEMKEKAENLLSVEQLSKGSLPAPWTTLRISDLLTILGLTVLGACLILGLFTRFSALMAAIMLFMFYAAMPPWPGLPEVPGPEHSFIVNKTFIEVIALLAIACLPSGRWFGADGMIGSWLAKRKMSKLAAD